MEITIIHQYLKRKVYVADQDFEFFLFDLPTLFNIDYIPVPCWTKGYFRASLSSVAVQILSYTRTLTRSIIYGGTEVTYVCFYFYFTKSCARVTKSCARDT